MKFLVLLFVFPIFMMACSTPQEKEHDKETEKEPKVDTLAKYKEVIEMEDKLFETLEPDTAIAEQMIKLYVDYATAFPKDTASPEFLFKAAEIARGFGKPTDAINYLSQIEARYPDFNKSGTVLFLKANIFHFYLDNINEAEKYYTKFIENYPEHALISDAKSALMFLDFDDDELIQVFKNLN